MKRTITASLLVSLSLWLLWMESPYVEAYCVVLTLLLSWEVLRMFSNYSWPLRLLLLLYVFTGMMGLYAAWSESRAVLYWILAVIWSNDICAYIVGKSVGGPKLIPSISPQKTWSGFIGGMVWGAAVGLASAKFLNLPVAFNEHILLLSIATPFVGSIGDLMESALKRRAQIKDSGALLPGHGGFFDRMDSLLFVGILIFAFDIFRTVASHY